MIILHALYVLCSAAGAGVFNRFRGGGIVLFPWETPDHKATQVRRVLYSLYMGFLAWNPWVILATFLPLLTGWGYAVSVAIGAKNGPRESQFWPFDFLADLLTRGCTERTFGVVWLTLHGLCTGFLVCAATQSFWPLCWAGMGLCYRLAGDWERGEIYDGILKGFTLALATITAF